MMTAPGAQHPGTFCSGNLWACLFPKSCGYRVILGVSTAAWRSRGSGCLGFCPGLAHVTLGSDERSGPAVTRPQGTAWGFVSCLCCHPALGESSFCPGVLTSSAAAGLWVSSTYTRCGSAAFPEPCVSRERSSLASTLCCQVFSFVSQQNFSGKCHAQLTSQPSAYAGNKGLSNGLSVKTASSSSLKYSCCRAWPPRQLQMQ